MLNKREITVYISGPYSGNTERNIEIAAYFAARIWDMGFTAICPHTNTAGFENRCESTKYKDFIEGDLVILRMCKVIFMIPEWQTSGGARTEHEFAKDKHIPAVYSLEELHKLFTEEEEEDEEWADNL